MDTDADRRWADLLGRIAAARGPRFVFIDSRKGERRKVPTTIRTAEAGAASPPAPPLPPGGDVPPAHDLLRKEKGVRHGGYLPEDVGVGRNEGGPRGGLSGSLQRDLVREVLRIGVDVAGGIGVALSDWWDDFRVRARAAAASAARESYTPTMPPSAMPPTATPATTTEIGVPDTEPSLPDRADENPPAPAARFHEIVGPDGQAIFVPPPEDA